MYQVCGITVPPLNDRWITNANGDDYGDKYVLKLSIKSYKHVDNGSLFEHFVRPPGDYDQFKISGLDLEYYLCFLIYFLLLGEFSNIYLYYLYYYIYTFVVKLQVNKLYIYYCDLFM